MLLLQFALLNVLCLRHCISDKTITSTNESSIRSKLILRKTNFPALIQSKQTTQFIPPQDDIGVNFRRSQRLHQYHILRREQIKTEGFDTNAKLPLSNNLVQLFRDKRYIVNLESNLPSHELSDKKSKSNTKSNETAISRLFSTRQKQKGRELPAGYPKVVLPIQKLSADVGISFQKYLSPDIFHDKRDGNANSLNVELLTFDGKKLFASSWIKFDQSNLKLYGFPLKGNQDEHSFILKATNTKGRSAVQKISIVVYALEPIYNHYVHLCTTMTLSDYGGSVERRLRLAKIIANYIFPGTRPEDVWIWKFHEGCLYVTFRHLPRNGHCDFNALQRIEDKVFHDGDVNSAFQQALKGITDIVSLNLTVLDECRKSNATDIHDGLGWLRDIAPVFILIAVVAVPTLISCIVCREVRRRQAAMRQLQDRRMKEDREQMLLQAAEYKHECGFDSESEDGEGCANRPFRQQEEEAKKFFGFSRIADIILPEVVIDTVKQGTEIFNTFLPQETRDAATNERKGSANKLFPTVTVTNATNRFPGTSQEEEEKSIEKGEFSITSKVKGMFNFIKSPLDIASMGDDIDSKDECNHNKIKVPEKRKLSKIPADTLLPSISSIFGLDPNDGAHGPLREIRNSMSTTIRSKFQLMVKAASMNTSKGSVDDDEGQADYQLGGAEASELNDRFCVPSVQSRKASKMLGIASDAYIDCSRSVPILAPKLGARARVSDQKKILDTNAICKSNVEDVGRRGTSEENTNEDGLLNRILYQSKYLLSSTKHWRSSKQESQEEIQLKDITRGQEFGADHKDRLSGYNTTDLIREPIKECKQSKGNTGMSLNLSTSCDVLHSKNHVRDCICIEHSNPLRYYHNTSKDHNAQNTTIDLRTESTPASCFSQAAVKNHKLLENTDLCFVNIGEAQLEKERSLIEAADGNWRESECRSGRQESNEIQSHVSLLSDRFEISNIERENSLNSGGQLDVSVSRGLQHYDPQSGKWYPAYTSLKKIVPAGKMFSLLESFKRNEEKSISQTSSKHGERMHKGSLHWYEINDEVAERQRETERNRRKTGMDIGTRILFDHISDSQYEQGKEPEFNYEMNHMRCTGRRKESIGIWTENIYDDDIDDSDVCQSSDEETDLQDLINKMQNEKSLSYRYCPSEQCREEYYSDEAVACERYRTEQAGYPEVMNTIPEDDFIGEEDFMDDPSPFQMYFKCAEDEKDHVLYDKRHLEDNRWSHSTDPVQSDGILTADTERAYPKATSEDEVEQGCFEAMQDDSSAIAEGRRRSSTDSQLQLSTAPLETVDSPTRSEPGCTKKTKEGVKMQKERRKSFLERQRRVEIPEKAVPNNDQATAPKIHVNPIFVIEERMSKEEIEERGNVEDRFDFAAVKKLQSSQDQAPKSTVRMRKLTYSGPFPTANIEAEKFRKQDADIIEHQTKGYLERRRQSLQHITGVNQLGKGNVGETEPIAIQNRTKREDAQRRTGMRRFSTPSMDSWTSTPEKYYYDATGDNSISEEDVNCAGLRKDKEKKSFTSGRGRAKEYTQRLLQGVSPKIRRHSTSILGQKCNHGQSGSSVTNTGTFLGKIGEGKFVQTIQTKLGKKDSKAEEPKSPITKEKEKYMEEEKQLKGSPLTAIRNTLFLFSGGK